MLSKTMGSLVCMAALLAGAAAFADQIQTQPNGQSQPLAEKPDPTLTPQEISEREQEYLAALKKCEPLAEGMRQDCINTVKSKYGLM